MPAGKIGQRDNRGCHPYLPARLLIADKDGAQPTRSPAQALISRNVISLLSYNFLISSQRNC